MMPALGAPLMITYAGAPPTMQPGYPGMAQGYAQGPPGANYAGMNGFPPSF